MSGVWVAGCSISMAPASDDSPVLTSVSISGSSKSFLGPEIADFYRSALQLVFYWYLRVM